MKAGKLFIVATPIGNLGDITFRAIETLKSVDQIYCEDTRQSKKLCDKYEINTPLASFHAQSSDTKVQTIIDKIKTGKDLAYISDAGTPCISDPGFKLTRLATQNNLTIIPIPGACAVTTLISASGIPANEFEFWGFIPHKKGRQTLIKKAAEAPRAVFFYESVHRFPKLLKELEAFIGTKKNIIVGRELTKLHEEIWRGSIQEALLHFNDQNTKGEFVIGLY